MLPVYEQSIRNCPWVVEFWIGYARAMERNSVDTEDVHGKEISGIEKELRKLP